MAAGGGRSSKECSIAVGKGVALKIGDNISSRILIDLCDERVACSRVMRSRLSWVFERASAADDHEAMSSGEWGGKGDSEPEKRFLRLVVDRYRNSWSVWVDKRNENDRIDKLVLVEDDR